MNRVAVAAAALVTALLVPPAAVAGAQPDEPDAPPGIRLSRAVAELPLSSPELRTAKGALERMEVRQREAERRLQEVGPELSSLLVETRALREVVARRDAQIRKAEAALGAARTAVKAIAVEWFVTGFGALEGLDPALTSAERERLSRLAVVSESAALAALEDQRALEGHLQRLVSDRDRLDGLRSERADRARSLEEERTELTATLEEAARRLPQLAREVEVAEMGADVEGTDLSATALDAYWRAEQAMALLDPDCGIRWWVLAGIGKVESGHGTYRGNQLATDGRVSPGIYGPMLDGSGPFAIVRDSDGGLLDGTAATDRAVGPMQFIPSTWRAFASDGTGDGTTDPQNLFDAAVAAGRYLCRSGPGLDSEDRLRAAVFSYNHSLAYVDQVLTLASRYRAALALSR